MALLILPHVTMPGSFVLVHYRVVGQESPMHVGWELSKAAMPPWCSWMPMSAWVFTQSIIWYQYSMRTPRHW
jgi:hypothetical protein